MIATGYSGRPHARRRAATTQTTPSDHRDGEDREAGQDQALRQRDRARRAARRGFLNDEVVEALALEVALLEQVDRRASAAGQREHARRRRWRARCGCGRAASDPLLGWPTGDSRAAASTPEHDRRQRPRRRDRAGSASVAGQVAAARRSRPGSRAPRAPTPPGGPARRRASRCRRRGRPSATDQHARATPASQPAGPARTTPGSRWRRRRRGRSRARTPATAAPTAAAIAGIGRRDQQRSATARNGGSPTKPADHLVRGVDEDDRAGHVIGAHLGQLLLVLDLARAGRGDRRRRRRPRAKQTAGLISKARPSSVEHHADRPRARPCLRRDQRLEPAMEMNRRATRRRSYRDPGGLHAARSPGLLPRAAERYTRGRHGQRDTSSRDHRRQLRDRSPQVRACRSSSTSGRSGAAPASRSRRSSTRSPTSTRAGSRSASSTSITTRSSRSSSA